MCYDIWDLSKKYYTSTVLFQTSRDSVWFNAVSKKVNTTVSCLFTNFSTASVTRQSCHSTFTTTPPRIKLMIEEVLKTTTYENEKNFQNQNTRFIHSRITIIIAAHIHTHLWFSSPDPPPFKKRHTGHAPAAPAACLPLFSRRRQWLLQRIQKYYYKKNQAKIIKFFCPPASTTTTTTFPA